MEKNKNASSATTCKPRRLKREECHRTKHDPVFSKWKILIGALDWENHGLGKDGSERYRLHNLPLSSSCPGIYELGVGAAHQNARSHLARSREIIVVYLGQADNVRTRLQHYGRAGSHLDNGNYHSNNSCQSSSLLKNKKDPGFFKDVFNRGFSLVFRWAPMETKKQAEDTESLVLGTFDYAWNKISNGCCRRDDILIKLDAISSSNPLTAMFTELRLLKQHVFDRKKYGIRIDAGRRKAQLESSPGFDAPIFKFLKSRPRLVVETNDTESNSTYDDSSVCGMVKADGSSICMKKAVQGRKRCQQHKGKRRGRTRNINESSSHVDGVHIPCSEIEVETIVCGVGLEDGNTCMVMPTKGRKRCEFHKGKRISKS